MNPRDCLHETQPISIPMQEPPISLHHNTVNTKAIAASTQAVKKNILLGESALIKRLQQLANKLANKDISVLIQGDSGTGKEVLARYIHQQSSRADQTFHAINCAAIPDTMLESLLFGFEKGVFTGAHKTHLGKFEQAHGSTLLLDEISEMPLDLQAKLLRILQEKEVERLGGLKPEAIDVRVIATCNKSLIECVKKGTFREDLYFRLSVFPLVIPQLRQRPEDIPLLSSYFITRYGSEQSFIQQEAVQLLMQYHWPGNVRELENVIQRALLLCDDQLILPEHICFDDVSFINEASQPDSMGDYLADADEANQQNQPQESIQPVNHYEPEEKLETLQQIIDETQNMSQSLLIAERQLIMEAIKTSRSKKAAASKLGISPRTLRYKLAKLKEQGLCIEAEQSMTLGGPYVE